MAELTLVDDSHWIALPDDLDDVTAAALANPGMSSWAAFKEVANLTAGETVLINGATGVAGRLAIQVAKHLGAKKVIATGRNAAVLQSLPALGADVTLQLQEDLGGFEDQLKEQFAEGVDVVLDYLWGASAERILSAKSKVDVPSQTLRFVQVGSISSPTIALPAGFLRSSPIQLMGSGLGRIPTERLVIAIGELLSAAVPAGLNVVSDPVPLSAIEKVWQNNENEGRTVFVPG